MLKKSKRQENGKMLGKERRQAWREKSVSSIPDKAGGWGGETRESPCIPHSFLAYLVNECASP